jgi:hypothetical protein
MNENYYEQPNETISFSQEVIPSNDAEIEPQVYVEPEPGQQEPVGVNLYAYIDKCVSTNTTADGCPDLYFDMFVNVTSPDGKSGTVIKKIKLCKLDLMNDLEHQAQLKVNVVESKDLSRIRRLAGISHPKNYL